jgi:acetyltransferase-like isoleucine patch superfamily enzyme
VARAAERDLSALASRLRARARANTRRCSTEMAVRLSAAAMSLQAAWQGVTIGEDCRFYGVVRLRRSGHGRITIGERCVFRSARWSNPVGVDRPTSLSTVGLGAKLVIGNDSGFTATVIAAAQEIVIGDRVLCGSNVTIIDADWHGLDPEERRGGVGKTAPVHIEDDVFLGLDVIVLKGVTIGRGSVVGAGSVVTTSIPPRSVAAGNPAQVIGSV